MVLVSIPPVTNYFLFICSSKNFLTLLFLFRAFQIRETIAGEVLPCAPSLPRARSSPRPFRQCESDAPVERVPCYKVPPKTDTWPRGSSPTTHRRTVGFIYLCNKSTEKDFQICVSKDKLFVTNFTSLCLRQISQRAESVLRNQPVKNLALKWHHLSAQYKLFCRRKNLLFVC